MLLLHNVQEALNVFQLVDQPGQQLVDLLPVQEAGEKVHQLGKARDALRLDLDLLQPLLQALVSGNAASGLDPLHGAAEVDGFKDLKKRGADPTPLVVPDLRGLVRIGPLLGLRRHDRAELSDEGFPSLRADPGFVVVIQRKAEELVQLVADAVVLLVSDLVLVRGKQDLTQRLEAEAQIAVLFSHGKLIVFLRNGLSLRIGPGFQRPE